MPAADDILCIARTCVAGTAGGGVGFSYMSTEVITAKCKYL